MDIREEKLRKFCEFLNTQGFDIDFKDGFWMEDQLFDNSHKLRDVFELAEEYSLLRVAEEHKLFNDRLDKIKSTIEAVRELTETEMYILNGVRGLLSKLNEK